MKVYSVTKGLCSKCKQTVDAKIIEKKDKIYLQKVCAEHGSSESLICSDVDWFKESRTYIKQGQFPMDTSVKEFSGCPDSCGLCPEHQQHTCLPIIEITSQCDLDCPICLKDFQNPYSIRPQQFDFILKRLKECEEQVHVINLSGGEPTLHPDFEEFLRITDKNSIMQTTVSTNGLELLKSKKLRELFKDTGTIAALQFDGFKSKTYQRLRGVDLSKRKQELIELFEKEGIKYSLVTTVVQNVNVGEITKITDTFFKSKALSLMFQPAVFTGRAELFNRKKLRVTIPDVIKEIEKSEYVNNGDFNPLPCSHYSCFALSYYLHIEDKRFMSLKEFLGKENYLNFISNRTLPGLDAEGYSIIKEKLYELWSASDFANSSEKVLQRIRSIFDEINSKDHSPRTMFNLGTESMKGIFIHQFMDADTLDFGRLIKCCNHYPQTDGRIIPMCAQNVFFQ